MGLGLSWLTSPPNIRDEHAASTRQGENGVGEEGVFAAWPFPPAVLHMESAAWAAEPVCLTL